VDVVGRDPGRDTIDIRRGQLSTPENSLYSCLPKTKPISTLLERISGK
jgi:hypothetical protein